MVKAREPPASKLDPQVQTLIKFIFDYEMMKQSMVTIGVDINRMPLGDLSKETVLKGYRTLKKISDVLNGKTKGDLVDLSS